MGATPVPLDKRVWMVVVLGAMVLWLSSMSLATAGDKAKVKKNKNAFHRSGLQDLVRFATRVVKLTTTIILSGPFSRFIQFCCGSVSSWNCCLAKASGIFGPGTSSFGSEGSSVAAEDEAEVAASGKKREKERQKPKLRS